MKLRKLSALACAALLSLPALMAGGLGKLKPGAETAPKVAAASTLHKSPSAAPAKAAARADLYGVCTASRTPAISPTIRTFRAGYSPAPQKVANLEQMAGCSGTNVGGEFGYMHYTVNGSGSLTSVTWTRRNLTDFKVTSSQSQSYGLGVSMDMTADPTTGTIYAISALADYLLTIDPKTGEASVVAPTLPFYTLSADASGQLYGILLDTATREGVLYTINKMTGAALKIGSTGAKMLTNEAGTSAYFQTASFSSANGNLYWCMVNSEGTPALYMVDPATGSATYMAPFPDEEEFTSLFDIEKPASAAVPATVSDATATPDPSGALAVDLAFTAPAKTVGGTPIDLIERIDIYRGASREAAYTEEYPEPSQRITWRDTEAKAGFNGYRIVAVNSEGESTPVYLSAFCGADYPDAPTEVAVATDTHGYPVISWTAPSIGLNGLALDPSTLTYAVVRDFNGTVTRVAEGLTATSFTDTSVPLDRQAYPYYTVVASSPAGEGKISAAAGCYTGAAYPLPFFESFKDCLLSTNPWIMQSLELGGRWELNYISTFPGSGPADDTGMLVFIGFQSVDGAEARIATPLLDFTTAKNPELSFQFFYLDMTDQDLRFNDHMTVEASIDGGPFLPIPGADYYQHDANTRWTEVRLPLTSLAGQRNVALGFHGYSAGGFDLLLDRISVTSTPASPDGIDLLPANADTEADTLYDLQGRPVLTPNPAPGLYLRAGEKVHIR